MGKKLTYEYVKEYIESFENYTLLSTDYKNNNTKLSIVCPKGHIFNIGWSHFLRGQRCSKCDISKKKSHKEVRQYIEVFGYELLSDTYKNSSTKLSIKCSKDHIFDMNFNSFQQGNRCPKCAGNNKYTYQEVKEYVESFNYELLSNFYTNNSTKLKMKCPNGHIIKMNFANFKHGYRCGDCFGKKQKVIEEVKAYIESYDGYKLLSDSYINNEEKLKIICPLNHIFYMSYGSFQQGRRCSECAKNIRKQKRFLKFEDVKQFIESQDGYILLSKTYKYKKSKLSIQCPKEHTFNMSYDKFQQGQRCPICQNSKGEEKVRIYLKQHNIIYQRQYSFDDCRNIEPLRFDFAIFDDSNNISFMCEYDGEYHYLPIEGEKKLKYQQKLDKIKNTYCQQNKIPLLRIPYWDFDNIEQILSQELTKYKLTA